MLSFYRIITTKKESFLWSFQYFIVDLQKNIINIIIMLGINAPKILVKGKYAKAVRKAAIASIGSKQKNNSPKASAYPYKFEWKL